MPLTDRPVRLLLAIPHLGGGGAEHVIALLARHLDPALFETHLVLLTPDGPGAPIPPPHVQVHRLHGRRVRHALVPLLSLIRQLQPRLILSGMAHLNFLILLLKPLLPRQTRILLRQNTTASAASDHWLTRLAYRRLYPRAHRILCQSQAMAGDLVERFGISPDKLVVLHNPVAPPGAAELLRMPPSSLVRGPHLVFVGRLSHEKGADILLRAFAHLGKRYPSATLTLLGTGPEEASLRRLAHELEIASAVRFAGHVSPAAYFQEATLFVLSSRHEGVPNALLEAAAAGLPIIATPASGGIVDLLRDAPGCWLTPRITASALAQTLHEALTALAELPSRFTHRFVEPFRLEPAIAAYSDRLLAESRPTLAFLVPTLDQIGGAERQVLDLAHEFARRCWPVTLITLSGNGAAIPPHPALSHLSLKMRKAWIDPRGWLRYLRWHSSTHPEILHAHLPHASYFARLSRLFAPTPVLIDTIHTTAPGPFSRRLAYRLTHFLSDRLTCVSRAVQESVHLAGIAPDSTLLPNGIRIPERSGLSASESNAAFQWLAVGRLVPVKDYPTLLRAFRLLPSSATLTIAGAGLDEASLKALAAELNIASRVTFLGFRADIQSLLAEADAFVQSSLWEGLPISILEASAAGLPVVATDAAGVREALICGQTGFLVPVADSQALAAAMLNLMNAAPEQRRQIGLRGRAFVHSNFSLSAIADRWEQLYQQLLREAIPVPPPHSEPIPSTATPSKHAGL